MPTAAAIAKSIRKLLRERGAGKTICPSEVARDLADDWRPLMDPIRKVAAKLVEEGELIVTQRGRRVDALEAHGPIRLARADAAKTEYANAYRGIDFRKHPEKYRVGRGEEGVLIAEPYKSELLPLWRFRTPEIAKASSAALWKAFVAYRQADDGPGMDMARKFLQMGFTRARRYANRKSGRKYESRDVAKKRSARAKRPLEPDAEKAASAEIFHAVWQRAERDRKYRAWRDQRAI
jgi:hypothetical protein